MEEELLVEYAAGALGRASALLVATQCAMKPEVNQRVRELELIAGALLEHCDGEDGVSAGPAGLDERLVASFQSEDAAPPVAREIDPEFAGIPAPLRAALAGEPPDARWRMVMPGMTERLLPHVSDARGRAKLIRLKAGSAIPEHGHVGREITLVLDGAYYDEYGFYEPGSISVVDDSVDHRPMVGKERDCICLAVEEGRLIVRRPLRELLRYFFG